MSAEELYVIQVDSKQLDLVENVVYNNDWFALLGLVLLIRLVDYAQQFVARRC